MNLKKKYNIGGFEFTFDEENNYYEARGGTYFDEDHDQVPEPRLQHAALLLQKELKEQGIESEISFGEKGWIEVYIEED